jgi:MFS transporter, SP family, general alpha glucoside:H+ symporter
MKDKQVEAAAATIKKLSGGAEDIDARLDQIQKAVDEERRLSAEKAYFIEGFKGVNWYRSRIILACMYLPQVVGVVLASNAPYFLDQTGM